jgi:uncharacterized YigZ family protein
VVTRYKTITSAAESLFKEKASKFIGLAFPVADETEVKKILDETRKKYFDSRHVCYAYVLGPEKTYYKLSDAGEPSNTAGKPILGQIRAFDLTNVLVIVVRYFGGTKLGVGGLIQAYKQSAFDTLQKTTMVEQEVKKTYNLLCTYENLSKVMKEIKKRQADIVTHVQEEQCRLTVEISLEQEQNFVQAVQLMVMEIIPMA